MQRRADGSFARTGPLEILVTRESATRDIYSGLDQAQFAFPINANHSDLVKFSAGDDVYGIVLRNLGEAMRRNKLPHELYTGLIRHIGGPSHSLDDQTEPGNYLKSKIP